MDLNHRSPGYEPDGISRLPHLATPCATVHRFQTTVARPIMKTGGLMRWKVLHHRMRAARTKAIATLAVLVCASLAGCLSTVENENGANPITMAVHYESTSGTILERVQNGATLSQTGVELAFDFARVTSKAGVMETFTLDPGDDEDGSNAITVNANDQAEIAYTYQTHGLFTVTLSASDESGNEASTTVLVRVDKTIDWTQSNTDSPDSMSVSTTPDCTCPAPERIDVDSTISNPAGIIAGTPVTVTWHLDNPDGEQQAFHTEQIGDGQEASWTHSQYNIAIGDWALNVSIDSGNDSLNVHHIVTLSYEAIESPPNPVEAAPHEQESTSLSLLRNQNEK